MLRLKHFYNRHKLFSIAVQCVHPELYLHSAFWIGNLVLHIFLQVSNNRNKNGIVQGKLCQKNKQTTEYVCTHICLHLSMLYLRIIVKDYAMWYSNACGNILSYSIKPLQCRQHCGYVLQCFSPFLKTVCHQTHSVSTLYSCSCYSL